MNPDKISFIDKTKNLKFDSQSNSVNFLGGESFEKILSDKQVEMEEKMACRKKSAPVAKYAMPEYMLPHNRIIEAPMVKYAMPAIRNINTKKDDDDIIEKYAIPNEPDPIDSEDKNNINKTDKGVKKYAIPNYPQ